MSNRPSGQPNSEAAWHPEIDVVEGIAALRADIQQLAPLMPRIARQATYQTIPVNAGDTVSILGFDASRQSFTIAASSNTVYMGNDASIDSSGSTSAASPSILVPQFPAYFEFQHQAPVSVYNSGTTIAFVYVAVMSHGIA